MCIACELNFWAMIDALPEADRERILRQQAARFACEAPEREAQPAPQPVADEQQS
jgi:hypothetical protein